MKSKTLLVAFTAVLVTSNALAQVVYDNLTAPSTISGASSSTDLNAIYGDSMTLTQGGILDTFSFTFFNSSSGNTNSVLTAQFVLRFYDNTTPYAGGDLQTTLTEVGAFSTNVTFAGTGLAPGFAITINVTGIAPLAIVLPQNIFVTQQVASSTGGSTRMGVATFSTDNIGTGSNTSWYRQDVAGEGLFAFAPPTSNNLGYTVGVVPEPATMTMLAFGAAAIAARRRKKS